MRDRAARCPPQARFPRSPATTPAHPVEALGWGAVHAFGDFGQHQEGAPVDLGTAYSVLHLCVELTAALRRELPDKM